MNLHRRTNMIASLVSFCNYCHPLSGCAFSHLKGKQKAQIESYLADLGEDNYQRILSYHKSCPYSDRLAI